MTEIIVALITAAASIVVAIINSSSSRQERDRLHVRERDISVFQDERETISFHDGKHCPNCSADISVVTAVFSSSFRRIKCPTCGIVLGYDTGCGLYILEFIFAFLLGAISMLIIQIDFIWGCIFLFVFLCIYQFGFAIYYRNNKILKVTSRRR